MNNAKIWLVVKPTVGVPLFLSAVAVGSFAVHLAVVTNSDWVDDFLSGDELGEDEASLILEGDTNLQTASYAGSADGSGKILVEMPDGTLAYATVDAPAVLASAADTRLLPKH